MAIATASWGLHVAALALAPMSMIQVSLAAGVVFIAVMAERLFGFEVGRGHWAGLLLTADRTGRPRPDAAGDAWRALAVLAAPR